MKTLTINITDEAFELLKAIDKAGYAEYRDAEYSSLEEFKNSDLFLNKTRDEQWFVGRNFGGTYALVSELEKYGLVDTDDMAWNITYILTDFGKYAIKQ